MDSEDAGRIEAVAQAFSRSAPADWSSIRVEASSVTEVTGFTARATLPGGEVQSFYIEDDELEDRVIDEVENLRRQMATRSGDRGAWFTMTIDVSSDGKYSAQFDYESKPKFDFEVSRESLLADLEEFPRSTEFYPEWLR